MSIENNTGKPARLSLSERAKQGLLLSEPELSIDDIVNLEHPGNIAGRKALRPAIQAAIQYGDLATRTVCRPWQRTVWKSVGGWLDGNQNWDEKRLVNESGATKTVLIDREDYWAWRNACPAELLSPLSQVHKWLGATPPAATTLPVETSLPERRQRQDALNHAIRAAIAVLSPSGDPLPQPRALFDYLRTADQTKTVIDSSKEQLTWYSAETGRKQTATIANLKRRLDRWID